MHIITRKRLNDFAELHPGTATALEHWYKVMKQNSFDSLAELKTTFASDDKAG